MSGGEITVNNLTLSFDTSTPVGSVALTSDAGCLGEIRLGVPRKPHSDYILRHAELLLRECRLSLDALTGLIVINGPGSFTGLRVGLATVQGLAQSLDLPVYQVSSLQVMAFMAGPLPMPMYCFLDARKHELYGARIVWTDGPQVEEYFVLPPARICSMLNERHGEDPVALIGAGAHLYRDQFISQCSAEVCFAGVGSVLPEAGAAAQLVLTCPEQFAPRACTDLCALYVRPSDAELQKSVQTPLM